MINSIKQMLRGTPLYVLYKNLQATPFQISPKHFISN